MGNFIDTEWQSPAVLEQELAEVRNRVIAGQSVLSSKTEFEAETPTNLNPSPSCPSSRDWACLSTLCDRELLMKKLGPPERRLEVAGVNFRQLGTQSGTPSLFGAISLALTGSSEDWATFQHKTYAFMAQEDNWNDYYQRILDTFPSLREGSNKTPGQMLGSIRSRSPGTMVELHAAARRFRFTFTVLLVDAKSDEGHLPECVLQTDHDPEVTDWADEVKYTFVRWGGADIKTWHWEFLKPIGAPMDIPDGCYPYELKEAFVFPSPNQPLVPIIAEHRSPMTLRTTLVFAEALSEFRYYPQPNPVPDLFSLLSQVFYCNTAKAERIKSKIGIKRRNLAYVLHLSPRRKESLTPNGMHTKKSIRFARSAYANGDPTDLRLAATMFRFSYRIFGIYAGNPEGDWKRFLVRGEHGEQANGRRLFFGSYTGLTKQNRGTQQEWFLLQEWAYAGTRTHSSNSHRSVTAYDENKLLLEPILPRLSKHHSEPIRAPLSQMKQNISRLDRLLGKRKPGPETVLLPSNFSSQESKPVLHVDPELGRQVQFEVFHKLGVNGTAISHPELNYYPAVVSQAKPSTCFPLLAKAYAVPSHTEMLNSKQLERDPRLGFSLTTRNSERSRTATMKSTLSRSQSQFGGTTRSEIGWIGRTIRSVMEILRGGGRKMAALRRSVAAHFQETIR